MFNDFCANESQYFLIKKHVIFLLYYSSLAGITLCAPTKSSPPWYITLSDAQVKISSTRTLRWRHNDHAGVSNHQHHGCLLNRLFRRKSKKTSKLRVTGLCAGNSPGTGEFPAQMASYAENVSIWWRHHGMPHHRITAMIVTGLRQWYT